MILGDYFKSASIPYCGHFSRNRINIIYDFCARSAFSWVWWARHVTTGDGRPNVGGGPWGGVPLRPSLSLLSCSVVLTTQTPLAVSSTMILLIYCLTDPRYWMRQAVIENILILSPSLHYKSIKICSNTCVRSIVYLCIYSAYLKHCLFMLIIVKPCFIFRIPHYLFITISIYVDLFSLHIFFFCLFSLFCCIPFIIRTNLVSPKV